MNYDSYREILNRFLRVMRSSSSNLFHLDDFIAITGLDAQTAQDVLQFAEADLKITVLSPDFFLIKPLPSKSTKKAYDWHPDPVKLQVLLNAIPDNWIRSSQLFESVNIFFSQTSFNRYIRYLLCHQFIERKFTKYNRFKGRKSFYRKIKSNINLNQLPSWLQTIKGGNYETIQKP